MSRWRSRDAAFAPSTCASALSRAWTRRGRRPGCRARRSWAEAVSAPRILWVRGRRGCAGRGPRLRALRRGDAPVVPWGRGRSVLFGGEAFGCPWGRADATLFPAIGPRWGVPWSRPCHRVPGSRFVRAHAGFLCESTGSRLVLSLFSHLESGDGMVRSGVRLHSAALAPRTAARGRRSGARLQTEDGHIRACEEITGSRAAERRHMDPRARRLDFFTGFQSGGNVLVRPRFSSASHRRSGSK